MVGFVLLTKTYIVRPSCFTPEKCREQPWIYSFWTVFQVIKGAHAYAVQQTDQTFSLQEYSSILLTPNLQMISSSLDLYLCFVFLSSFLLFNLGIGMIEQKSSVPIFNPRVFVQIVMLHCVVFVYLYFVVHLAFYLNILTLYTTCYNYSFPLIGIIHCAVPGWK